MEINNIKNEIQIRIERIEQLERFDKIFSNRNDYYNEFAENYAELNKLQDKLNDMEGNNAV